MFVEHFPFQNLVFFIIQYILLEGIMLYLNYNALAQFLSIYTKKQIETRFMHFNKRYNLNLRFEKFDRVVSMARRINYRQAKGCQIKRQNEEDSKQFCNYSWVFGEYKIFLWTIVILMIKHSIEMTSIKDEYLGIIMTIFPSKTIFFIKYYLQSMINQSSEIATVWDNEQWQLLQDIVNQMRETHKQIDWKQVSYLLYCRSNYRFFKIISKCRQKWMNHINPEVKKVKWQIEEDIKLFELIKQYGLKWSKISKSMDKTRTQHMVKNRYNCYLRKWNKQKSTKIEDAINQFVQTVKQSYLFKKQLQRNRIIAIRQKLPERCEQNNQMYRYRQTPTDKIKIEEMNMLIQCDEQNIQIIHYQNGDDDEIDDIKNDQDAVEYRIKDVRDRFQIIQNENMKNGLLKNEDIEVKIQYIQYQKQDKQRNPNLVYYPFMNCYMPTEK